MFIKCPAPISKPFKPIVQFLRHCLIHLVPIDEQGVYVRELALRLTILHRSTGPVLMAALWGLGRLLWTLERLGLLR